MKKEILNLDEWLGSKFDTETSWPFAKLLL